MTQQNNKDDIYHLIICCLKFCMNKLLQLQYKGGECNFGLSI